MIWQGTPKLLNLWQIQFLDVFWTHLRHFSTFWVLQRTYYSMIQIKWCWFHSKIFLFGHTFFGQIRRLLFIDRSWWGDIQFMMLIFHFWFFGSFLMRKWVWSPRAPLLVWGLQTRPKIWPTWWTFWANHYLEIRFSKFSGESHPPSMS